MCLVGEPKWLLQLTVQTTRRRRKPFHLSISRLPTAGLCQCGVARNRPTFFSCRIFPRGGCVFGLSSCTNAAVPVCAASRVLWLKLGHNGRHRQMRAIATGMTQMPASSTEHVTYEYSIKRKREGFFCLFFCLMLNQVPPFPLPPALCAKRNRRAVPSSHSLAEGGAFG